MLGVLHYLVLDTGLLRLRFSSPFPANGEPVPAYLIASANTVVDLGNPGLQYREDIAWISRLTRTIAFPVHAQAPPFVGVILIAVSSTKGWGGKFNLAS
jgi:hypothetical protein